LLEIDQVMSAYSQISVDPEIPYKLSYKDILIYHQLALFQADTMLFGAI